MDNNADNLLGKIRTQAQSFNVPSSPYNAPSLDYLRPAPINVNKDAGKLKFNEFTNISQDTVFKELSDGSKVSMYKNFIPGTDNNERLAQQQTGWEQVKNGLIKAKLNMDSVILGNTVGFVYGLADWARTGNFNSVYDNSFSNTLADWNTTLNYQLPNYVSQQEKDLSIVGKMSTANFWANDIANGLSFTMGTIVSEAIWASATGGASLGVRLGRLGAGVGRAGRWGKAALTLEKTAEGVRGWKAMINTALDNAVVGGKLSTKAATTLAKTGEVLNTARFIATSSGNEAGIEALHYKREQRENYLDNFEKLNGRAPSQEEISDFEEKLNDSANGVFGANMAILSVSNLATFGKMFNIKTPLKSISTQANKSLFGVGVEKTAEGVYKGLQATKFQKGLGLAYTIAKPFATEGLFEEGLQGAATKTANNWIESSYDPKYMGKTMSLGVASSKALSEQYGSKEGWEEVVIGGIVGLIGGGPTGQFTALKRARKEQEDFVAKGLNTFNSVFAQDVLAERFVLNSRLMSAMDRETDALKKRDAVSAHFASNDAIIANMQFEESDIIGGSADDVYRKFETALNAMSKEEFKQAGVENIEEHKENVLAGLKQVVTDFKKASNYANAVLGSDKIAGNTDYNIKVVKDALVHSWVQGQNASRVMSDELGEIGDIVGVENAKVLNTIQTLEALGKDKTREVSKLGRQYKDLDKKSQALQVEIAKVQAAPKETQGDRVKGNLAQQLQARLVDIEARKASIKTELEGIAKELESNNNQKQVYAEQAEINSKTSLLGEFVSVKDLLEIDDNLSKLDSIAESVKNNNKVLYNDLTESIERYQNAKQKLYAYNASVSAIVSGEFKLKTTNNFITSMLNKNKTVDERTGEILNYALENYSKINVTEQARVNNDELLNQAIESIKKGEEVEPSIIAEIAAKIDKALKLNTKETTIYNTKQEEVDAVVKRINDTPIAKTEEIAQEQEKTPIEDVEERIVNATKNFGSEYIGADNPEEMAKKRPSEKDIERYRELKQSKEIQDYETKGQLPLDTTLVEEFEKLQDKLSKWRVYDSLVDGQDSVADLLDLREQLLWQEDKEQTVDEILEEDYKDILDEFIKVSGTVTDYTLGDNFNFPPTLKRLENNRISFSFLKFPSIISKFNNPTVTIVSKEGDILDNFENLEQGTTVIVESEGNTFEFVLAEKGRIETDAKNLISMNLTTFSIPSWSYELIYEKVNGEYRTLPSDFRDDNMIGDTFQLQEGDSIELFVDANNEYNKQLLEENDKDKLVKDVVIYVVKNGEKYQILKALDKNNSNPEFQKLREVAAKTLKKGKSKVIATTNVSYIHLGLPIVNVGENGKPSPIDFTTSSLDQVVTTGYAFDGEITLADKTLEKDTRKTFVSKLSKNKQGKKLPIVVIKRGKHLIAYPVSLKKSPNPKLNEFDAIVNTTGATDGDKVRTINNLLKANGIAPSDFNLTSWDVNILEAIKNRLANLQQFIAADDLAKTDYDKNSLKADAQIALDLDDIKRVLPSQKINYDLTTLKYQEKEFQPKEPTEEEAKDLVKKAYDKTTTSDDYTKIQDSINEMFDNGVSNLEILKFLNKSKIGKELLTEDAEEIIVKDELKVPTESILTEKQEVVVVEDVAPAPKQKISGLVLKEGVTYTRNDGTVYTYDGKLWWIKSANPRMGKLYESEKNSQKITEDFLKEVRNIQTEKDLNNCR
jgi:hypothetical protein